MPFNRTVLDFNLDVINRAPNGGGLPVNNFSSINTSREETHRPHSNPISKIEELGMVAKGAERDVVTFPDSNQPNTFPNQQEFVTAINSLFQTALQQQSNQSVAQVATRIRNEVIEDTREWLEKKGIPKAVRVATHETLKYERKKGTGTCERSAVQEIAPEREHDPIALAEIERREAAEIFAIQVNWVRVLFKDGRSSADICAQYGFDDDTWNRILRVINEDTA